MSEYLHVTDHLGVDWLDRVWIKEGVWATGHVFVGYLEEGLEWPRYPSPEPNWWITEVAELFDAWDASSRYARDYRATAEEAYRKAKEG